MVKLNHTKYKAKSSYKYYEWMLRDKHALQVSLRYVIPLRERGNHYMHKGIKEMLTGYLAILGGISRVTSYMKPLTLNQIMFCALRGCY